MENLSINLITQNIPITTTLRLFAKIFINYGARSATPLARELEHLGHAVEKACDDQINATLACLGLLFLGSVSYKVTPSIYNYIRVRYFFNPEPFSGEKKEEGQ